MTGPQAARDAASPPVAIVVGVGPGLGAALARRFARGGMAVAMAARSAGRLDPLVAEITAGGGTAAAHVCDATREQDVAALFVTVSRAFGGPDLVVFNASGRVRKPVVEIEVAELDQAWRQACLGGFIVGREAARCMLPRGGGTILFTGATASVKGFAGSAGFAIGKFGLRGLAQSMARELGPKGVHVAHVVIDGRIRTDARQETAAGGRDHLLDPAAIAETYWALHRQHRSAWTHEVDVRPWSESF